MRGKLGMVLAGLGSCLVFVAASRAETKVEVKGVHLCCGACVKGVSSALKGMKCVAPACDRDKKTLTITTLGEAAAQKALDALAVAGYYGDPDSNGLAIKPTDDL